jgi:putative endopeptidase
MPTPAQSKFRSAQRLRPALSAAVLFAGLAGCDPEMQMQMMGPAVDRPPIQVNWMDRRQNPCENFHQFACGAWMAGNGLGQGQAQKSSFTKEMDQMITRSIGLIRDFAKRRDTTSSPEERAIGNYYQACLDAPKKPEARTRVRQLLGKVDGIATLDDYARVSAEFRKHGTIGLFSTGVGTDPGDTDRSILFLSPGGGFMASSVYLDPARAQILDLYQKHIQKHAQLIGVTIDPAAVVRVESALAKITLPAIDSRNPYATYNKTPFNDLVGKATKFPWRLFLDGLGFGPVNDVNLTVPAYFNGLGPFFDAVAIDDLKHHLRWRFLENRARRLDQEFLTEEFNFHDVALNGVTTMASRETACLSATYSTLLSVLSRPYIEKYFDPSLRERAKDILQAIRKTFRGRIMTRDWLDDETRAEALTKLEAIVEKIAYPDPWPGIPIATEYATWLDEQLDTALMVSERLPTVLEAMPDRRPWAQAPLEINAAYVPLRNEILFPAGILQPPHFDPRRPRHANIAAIGATMGHEFTHGFDDRGRQYDASGKLRMWWTPKVADEYNRRAQCLVDRYSKFEAFQGEFVDGKLTLGENIADLGGTRLAYETFKAEGGMTAPVFESFDGRQQFFIAYAQVWCSVTDVSYAKTLLRADPHAPDKLRVHGPFSQMPEFAEAFNCPMGAPIPNLPVCEVW